MVVVSIMVAICWYNAAISLIFTIYSNFIAMVCAIGYLYYGMLSFEDKWDRVTGWNGDGRGE
jgi:hypothetical protein